MKTKQIPDFSCHVIVVNMQPSLSLILLTADHAAMLLPLRLSLIVSNGETKLMTQIGIFSFPLGEGFTTFTV
jgi:hypothetical protein